MLLFEFKNFKKKVIVVIKKVKLSEIYLKNFTDAKKKNIYIYKYVLILIKALYKLHMKQINKYEYCCLSQYHVCSQKCKQIENSHFVNKDGVVMKGKWIIKVL